MVEFYLQLDGGEVLACERLRGGGGGYLGTWYGHEDAFTDRDGEPLAVIGAVISQRSVCFVSAQGVDKDGKPFGFSRLYKHGSWRSGPNDLPLLCAWERLV